MAENPSTGWRRQRELDPAVDHVRRSRGAGEERAGRRAVGVRSPPGARRGRSGCGSRSSSPPSAHAATLGTRATATAAAVVLARCVGVGMAAPFACGAEPRSCDGPGPGRIGRRSRRRPERVPTPPGNDGTRVPSARDTARRTVRCERGTVEWEDADGRLRRAAGAAGRATGRRARAPRLRRGRRARRPRRRASSSPCASPTGGAEPEGMNWWLVTWIVVGLAYTVAGTALLTRRGRRLLGGCFVVVGAGRDDHGRRHPVPRLRRRPTPAPGGRGSPGPIGGPDRSAPACSSGSCRGCCWHRRGGTAAHARLAWWTTAVAVAVLVAHRRCRRACGRSSGP